MEKVEKLLDKRKKLPCELIEVLQDIQEEFNYLPEEALRIVSERLKSPLIEVFRVANFYKAFTLKERGKHLITACMGTACHVRGAPRLLDEILGFLKIKPGETTPDRLFTVETVNCLGACALSPIIVMDGKYYEHMTAGKLRTLVENITKEDNKEK